MARKPKPLDQDGQHLAALCAMNENDITAKILKPLFVAMGWERVEFYGGPHERGVDLIAQRKFPPRAKDFVLVAQTKKIAGLASHELSRLIHQLRQACSAPINAAPGERVVPDDVYLACPERMTSRLLDEIASQLGSPGPAIQIYDGPQILRDIKLHKAELLAELGTVHDRLVALDALGLKNQELLDALSSQTPAEVKNFYSDLSFFVGSIDSNRLLHLELIPGQSLVTALPASWPAIRQQIEQVQAKYGISLASQSVGEIEHAFDQARRAYISPKNKQEMAALDLARKSREQLQIAATNLLQGIEAQYRAEKKKPDSSSDTVLEFLDTIKAFLADKALPRSSVELPAKLRPIPTPLQPLIELVSELSRLDERINLLAESVLPEPSYQIEFAFAQVSTAIASLIGKYLSGIARIEKREMPTPELRRFLKETLSTLGLIAQIEGDTSELRQGIVFRRKVFEQDRVSISPHDVFDSRENIAVYGGAGVGKTTTLKAYLERSYQAGRRDLIYVPLNRIVDKLVRIGQSFNKADVSQLELDIPVKGTPELLLRNWLSDRLLAKVILISRGLRYEEADVAEAQALLAGGVTLILDGLDEAFDTVPQLIGAISDFNKTNRRSQLIVSSRDCVSYLREIDFLGITLLPFTQDQLTRFVRGWFGDSEKAERLLSAIEERSLFEHMRTPLLSTIVCVLMEKGIEAHTNEREIYNERIRLLTGGYDVHKQIRRQTQSSDLLQRVARRTAYGMHKKRVRSMPLAAIEAIAVEAFVDSHSADLIRTCVRELVNPCNVLVFDASTTEYSFGHFRFQEHLASEELRGAPRSELIDRLANDWWRGSLCLYAQDADIHELFEETYRAKGNVRSAERTFREMIGNAPRKKRKSLLQLFESFVGADETDELLFGIDSSSDYSDEFADEGTAKGDWW